MSRVREAAALCVPDADSAEYVPQVHLPAHARRAVMRSRSARQRAAAEQARSQDVTAEAVRFLREDMGMSTRDVAEVLGLSHQRVSQLERTSG